MNLPNQLTLGRLMATAVFVISLTVPFPYHLSAALILFLLASVTDYFDGALARKYGLVTDFGSLMDPLADKILTAAAFICLTSFGALPPWVVIIIISREFLVTGLRLLAAHKGIVLPAERLGKHKTVWQIATILFFLGMLAIGEWMKVPSPYYQTAWNVLGTAMVVIVTVLTIYSGLGYLWRNRHLITGE